LRVVRRLSRVACRLSPVPPPPAFLIAGRPSPVACSSASGIACFLSPVPCPLFPHRRSPVPAGHFQLCFDHREV